MEGAVALALFLEVLEGVGGAAHGVCHFGGCCVVVDVKCEVRGEVVIFEGGRSVVSSRGYLGDWNGIVCSGDPRQRFYMRRCRNYWNKETSMRSAEQTSAFIVAFKGKIVYW